MPDAAQARLAILLVAAISLASRVSGPLLMARWPMPAGVERFLKNLSLRVVATMLARGGLREVAAVAVAAGAMLALRKSVWAMGAGMVAAALWTATLG